MLVKDIIDLFNNNTTIRIYTESSVAPLITTTVKKIKFSHCCYEVPILNLTFNNFDNSITIDIDDKYGDDNV